MNIRPISAATLALLMATTFAFSSTALEPIPKKWQDAFSTLEADPNPPKLTRNSHYWVSDEQRHDLFMEAISNKGGVFIGLGTDQNYLMAAWARPEILVPLDFDQMVVSLHFAFRVVFLNAKTPEEFVNMWSEKEQKNTLALIAAEYTDPADFKEIKKAFKQGRRRVYPRLKRTIRSYNRLGVPTYLTDEAQYQLIVALFKTGRVFPIRGDLTANATVKDVAKKTRECGLTIRTLYLSNAEQYFKYTPGYKENMLSLPFDDESVVIRTAGTKAEWAADGVYDYIVQTGANFRAWLQYKKAFNVWTLVAQRDVNKKTGGSVIETLPPEPDDKK